MNLNQYLNPPDSLIARKRQEIGFMFESGYEVQTRFVKTSNLQVRNLVSRSETASATGTAGNGNWLTFEITLTPNPPFQTISNFANLFGAIYEGTSAVGSMQIWPKQGNGIGASDYEVRSGFDYRTYNGINSKYFINVINVAAGNVSIYGDFDWKYLDNTNPNE